MYTDRILQHIVYMVCTIEYIVLGYITYINLHTLLNIIHFSSLSNEKFVFLYFIRLDIKIFSLFTFSCMCIMYMYAGMFACMSEHVCLCASVH